MIGGINERLVAQSGSGQLLAMDGGCGEPAVEGFGRYLDFIGAGLAHGSPAQIALR
jgi:hypothetical protein